MNDREETLSVFRRRADDEPIVADREWKAPSTTKWLASA
jgi:hypothetical protein